MIRSGTQLLLVLLACSSVDAFAEAKRAATEKTQIVQNRGAKAAGTNQNAQPFTFQAITEHSLGLWENERPVLAYNHGSPRSEAASHSAYIHPLYGLDGEVLTDDFPKDHVYHRGLYWAWPHIRIADQEVDLWTLRGIRIQFERWLAREVRSDHAILGIENSWIVGNEKVVRETVWIRVHRAGPKNRALDLQLAWSPLKAVTLRGAPGKSYGGLTFRFGPRSQTIISTPKGRAPEDLLMTNLPWADFSGDFAAPGRLSGAAIFVHPDHPKFPPEWMTRHYGVLAVGWPGTTAETVPPGKTVTCSYRIWIHRGAPEITEIQKAYEQYRTRPQTLEP